MCNIFLYVKYLHYNYTRIIINEYLLNVLTWTLFISNTKDYLVRAKELQFSILNKRFVLCISGCYKSKNDSKKVLLDPKSHQTTIEVKTTR